MMRMIGKIRHTKLDCRWGCCDARWHNGKKGAKRTAKRAEKRDAYQEVIDDSGSSYHDGWPDGG